MSKAASAGLKVGQKAPDFTVTNEAGQKVKLSGFKGKKVVLYFYPKVKVDEHYDEVVDALEE